MRFRDEEQMLTVGGLNRAVRLQLEHTWGDLRIVGEIGDLSRPASGHLYFTLNDEVEAAQLRVVMFKSDVRRSRAVLENGARVALRGSLTLFEPRGTFQFQARAALPAGAGQLSAHFKRLLEKLKAEGLLDPARKRPLPLLPRCIGLVTSEQGAAMHDVIRVAHERCPVRIVVSPCLVQGSEAPRSIVVALRAVQRVPEVDVVILARGGGGAEDLWAFNDENVARAIVAARVPVVTGIGHEVDTTIADLVADVRAATPSNAAEVTVPQHRELEDQLAQRLRRLSRGFETRLARERLLLARLGAKLKHPRALLGRGEQRLASLEERLARAIQRRLTRSEALLDAQKRRLVPCDPRTRLSLQRSGFERARTRLALVRLGMFARPRRHIEQRQRTLEQNIEKRVLRDQHRFAFLVGRMQALSPLSVLSRGYAIAFSERSGKALRSAEETAPGEHLRLRLASGELTAQVLTTAPDVPLPKDES
ncbi:MAG: exodeoxyribonuclease VII large subunit [Myxococcales bacterium]